MLAAHTGQVITQTQLLKYIWGLPPVRNTHYLRNFIGKVRQKRHDDSDEPSYLQTDPGVGYWFLGHRNW